MAENHDNASSSPFDRLKRVDEDGEHWFARELQEPLGYASWDSFDKGVVERAKASAEAIRLDVVEHFRGVTKMVVLGSGAQRSVSDYRLTKYAAHLCVMNGDPRKKPVADGQLYFSQQTHFAEAVQGQLAARSDASIDDDLAGALEDQFARSEQRTIAPTPFVLTDEIARLALCAPPANVSLFERLLEREKDVSARANTAAETVVLAPESARLRDLTRTVPVPSRADPVVETAAETAADEALYSYSSWMHEVLKVTDKSAQYRRTMASVASTGARRLGIAVVVTRDGVKTYPARVWAEAYARMEAAEQRRSSRRRGNVRVVR